MINDLFKPKLIEDILCTLKQKRAKNKIFMSAIANNNPTIVEIMLLECPSRINRKIGKYDPLVWAAYHESIDVCRILLDKGALINTLNEKGNTVVDLFFLNDDVKNLLVQYANK